MKKNLKHFAMLALLAAGSMSAMAQQAAYQGLPTGDTWVRSDKPTDKYGSQAQMQMQTYAEGITSYGVMSFEFTAAQDGQEVKSAVVRTMTRVFNGGDRTLKVYALPEYVDGADNATWSSLGENLTKALDSEPIATITIKGQLGQNISKAGLNASMQTVEAWQNEIDLSAYVKSLTTNKFSILIAKVTDENKNSQFFQKEAPAMNWDASINGGAQVSEDDVRPLLTVEYQEAGQAQAASKTLPTGDSWVRSDKKDNKFGTTDNMQMQLYADGITSYGVMSFEFAAVEKGQEVKSAVLRTMTRVFNGGDRTLKVYALPEYVDDADNVTWNSLGENLTKALDSEPIATITIKGQLGQNISKAGLNASMQTVEAWQNEIDLTDYVKKLTTNKFSVLIAKVTDENKSSQFFTKEAAAMNWDASINDGAKVSEEDVRPLLTVSYKATESIADGIETVKKTANTEGIYTLSGQRVAKMGKGLYIVNGKKIMKR